VSVTRPLRVAAGSIASVDNLCAALAIERVELDSALALDESQKYLADSVPKADGTLRTVYNPHRLIRRIQRRINKRILSPAGMIAWPEFIYGSLPNQRDGEQLISKDYVACAGRHCGAKSVLKMESRLNRRS
jgi:RNA-directed DNA polymerase